MKITKSSQVLTSKPTNGNIKTSVTNVTTINSIDVLEDIVLKNPFNSSEANGIAEKDWLSQQIFTLDFDSGISPEEVIVRCRKLAFNPNIVYTTFSDTPDKRKFRVLFILDTQITDYKIAKWIQRGLMKLFPESDAACKDLCRMYYPGKFIINRVSALNETDWFTQYCHGQVASDERFWDKFDYSTSTAVLPSKLKDYDWNKATSEIRILDKFFNEDVRMSYDILFGLITNAQYIYGGEKRIFERMIEINNMGGGLYFPDINRGIETYPKEYFYSLKTIKRFNYMPKSLSNFSPFEEDHDFKNILEVKHKRGKVEILKEQNQISINSATKLMLDAFKAAKDNIPFTIEYTKPDMLTGEVFPYVKEGDALFEPVLYNPIYIFKITTGAGKSEAFLNEDSALIALPTHNLKDEISSRMKVFHKVTPRTPQFSDPIIDETLNQLRASGLFTEMSNIIKSMAKNSLSISGKKITLTKNDIADAQLYLALNKDCRKDDTTVLTTHTRAVNDVSFLHDFIIFDEDPLNDLINIESIDMDFSDFDNSQYKNFVTIIEGHLRGLPCECVQPMPRFSIPSGFAKFAASKGKGKIIKVLQSDFLFKSEKDPTKVNFVIKKDLLPEKKVFIMSATAPIPIYKKLFGNRVIVIDISNIKPMGVIEQWTKRSFSSSGMLNYNTKIYDDLFDNIGSSKVITHRKHLMKFKSRLLLDDPYLTEKMDINKPHMYYFGNCSGGDKLKGYDVSVVGTPNKPDFVYLFIAEIIGLPNSIDTTLSDQVVDWNDFRFRFFTYANKDLRDIQLSLIEAELLQAAGRSRFLRTRSNTKIFSSLPLKITTIFHEK